MNTDRRRLLAALAGAAAGAAATPTHANEPSMPRELLARSGIDAAALGIRPNTVEDQSKALQRAIESAAATRAVLHLPPGSYRAGSLQLPPYAAISGTPGATRIVMAGGPSLLSAAASDHVAISGLVLDGGGVPLPERRGLVHLTQGRAVRIAECEIVNAGRNGITLEAIEGDVTGNVVSAADIAIFSLDARGLRWGAYLRDVAVSANVIRNADFGITVSVAPGAGVAVIADNLISGVRRGAIVGMEWNKPVTGDLAKDGATRYAQLSIGGNRVR